MNLEELKNTIDLIKNINGLQINFNNQNLSFKNYTRNSKNITFTNKHGMDVNVSIDELNNQYKKKYTISNSSSVDTSIFNSKNKVLVGGNDELSATSLSFNSKLNDENFANSLTSNSSIQNSLKKNKVLVGGNDDLSVTSLSFNSKLNDENFANSLTSDSSIHNSLKKNKVLVGGKDDLSETSYSSKTSFFLVGGNNVDDKYSITSLDEASAFETESISSLNNNNILNGGALNNFSTDNESNNINKTFISINLDDIKIKNSNVETSSTLNSALNLKDNYNEDNNFFLKQNGGANNYKYNINSSSTSSICE